VIICDRVQHLAEYLIRRACRHLPDDTCDERYREWTAEIPAILHNPDTRWQGLRAANALAYAADHMRGARHHPRAGKPATARKPRAKVESEAATARQPTAVMLVLMPCALLAEAGSFVSIWQRAPSWLFWPLFALTMLLALASIVSFMRYRRRRRRSRTNLS
jgi:hypothetical protein